MSIERRRRRMRRGGPSNDEEGDRSDVDCNLTARNVNCAVVAGDDENVPRDGSSR